MPDKTPDASGRIADLKRRLSAEPTSRLFLELAREYYDSGQLAAAADVCAQGLKSHPAYLSARVLLGRICFDMGETGKSAEAMEIVLAQAPDNLVARRVLAEISMEEGDTELALDRYRALLAFYPGDAEARRKIELLEAKRASPPPQTAPATMAPAPAAAVLATATVPAAETVQTVSSGTLLDSGVLATPTLAEIYLQQGLHDKAAQVYREILRGDPGNADAIARLVEIERLSEAPDPAAQTREKKVAVLNRWLDVIRGGSRVA